MTIMRLSVRQLGIIAIIGFLLQPIIIWAFSLVISPDLPWSEPDSNYALGDLGWLRKVAFFGTGIAAGSLGLMVRQLFIGRAARMASIFLFIALVAQVGTGVFNTQPGIEGSPHDLFGLLSGLTLLGALIALSRMFSTNGHWRDLGLPTAVCTIWLVGSIALVITSAVEVGYVQRFLLLVVDGYMAWVAWKMRSMYVSSNVSERPEEEINVQV